MILPTRLCCFYVERSHMQSTLKTEFIASIRGWGEGLRETYKIPAGPGLRLWENAST